MWVVFWSGTEEAYYTCEEARFIYFLLKINGQHAGVKYKRTYFQ